ncbi:MAG: hypothetical protein VKN13_04835 [Cyanobacteriota bacterium]|nr:hypothetical protein [Cyanobacteriota bacterium]
MITKLDIAKPVLFSIAAYLDSRHTRPIRPAPFRMKARFDLSSVKTTEEAEYEQEQGLSTSAKQARYYATKSKKLSVKLFFNDLDMGSYGAGGNALGRDLRDISKQVALFERLCSAINGDSHEPSYLRLNWSVAGLQSSFEGRLESHDTNVTLFSHDGTPLVAEIEAKFTEAVDPKKQQARSRLSSPDLSHRHLVVAGETLPLLCLQYYGSTAPYLQVAAFNQLDDFIGLEPGSQLLFPPLHSPGGND